MPPSTYQKLVLARFSKDFRSAIETVQTPYRSPMANEIVVHNRYAGVNFTDIPLIMGRAPNHTKTPFDLGIESIGEVVEVGDGVSDIKVGDYVVTMMFGNGYREYATVDHKLAVKVPEITPEYLSLLSAGVHAAIALNVVSPIDAGQRVLVTAALSSTGHYAVQLAKLAGGYVIGTCGTDEEAELLQSLGCDRIVNRKHETLEVVLKREYSDGVDVVFESFGGHIFDVALKHLAPRGRLIIAGVIAEYTRHESAVHSVDIYDKLLWKSATLHGFWLPDYAQYYMQYARELLELHQAGKITTVIDPTPFKGLKSVPDALEYMNGWHSCGKVVVEI